MSDPIGIDTFAVQPIPDSQRDTSSLDPFRLIFGGVAEPAALHGPACPYGVPTSLNIASSV